MRKIAFVLEDDNDLRELFTYLLRQDGYEVSSYPDAKSFTRAIANLSPPDIVITDVRLPDGNGMEICNAIKDNPKTGHVPVLIMSAHKDLIAMKVNSKADDHLEKPFDIHLFLDKVNRLTTN